MSAPKRLCDRSCPSRAAFRVQLRDKDSGATESFQEVCGTHLTWAVSHLAWHARTLREIRKERGFDGEVVVANLRGGESGVQ